jgi:hypothetical protein
VHPVDRTIVRSYHIGTLAPSANQAAASEAPQEEPITPVFLDKKKWKSGRLSSIKQVSPDSKVFRFELQSEEQALGLVSPFRRKSGHRVDLKILIYFLFIR